MNTTTESNVISMVKKQQQTKATRRSVYAVCDAFSRNGIPLTINRIRNTLGGGGFSTIGRFRDEWIRTGGVLEDQENQESTKNGDEEKRKTGMLTLYLETGPIQRIVDKFDKVGNDIAGLHDRLDQHDKSIENLSNSIESLSEVLARIETQLVLGPQPADISVPTKEQVWLKTAKVVNRVDEAAEKLEQAGSRIASTLLDLRKRLEAFEKRMAEELLFDETMN